MSKRIEWIDITKGLAIILVVIGHTVPIDSKIYNIIFSFHMPLFFIISGYLFKDRDPHDLLKRNFKRMIIPYIATSFFIILGTSLILINTGLSSVMHNIKIMSIASLYGSGLDVPAPINVKMIGAIWFLLALYFAEYFFSIILKIARGNTLIQVGIITVVTLSGYLLAKIFWLPLSLNAAMIAVFYIYIGFQAKKISLFELKINKLLLLLMLLLWIFTYHVNGVILANGTFHYFPFTLFGSACGSYFVIKFCKYLCRWNFLKNLLSYIGKETLIILCFHLIDMYLVPYYLIPLHTAFIWTSVVILIRLALLFIIAVYAKKLTLIKKLYYAK